MAIMAAEGPRDTFTVSPCKEMKLSFPLKVIGVPLNTSSMATTIDNGNKILVQLLMK